MSDATPPPGELARIVKPFTLFDADADGVQAAEVLLGELPLSRAQVIRL